MDLQSIVAELKRERDRLSRALATLEERDSSPATTKPMAASASSAGPDRQGGGLTPAARQRLSEAMKQRWAARKKKRS